MAAKAKTKGKAKRNGAGIDPSLPTRGRGDLVAALKIVTVPGGYDVQVRVRAAGISRTAAAIAAMWTLARTLQDLGVNVSGMFKDSPWGAGEDLTVETRGKH